MLVVTVACIPIFYSGRTVSRWEGALFLAYFVAYTTYVLMAATGQAPPPTVRDALLFFAIPLTVLSLLIAVVRSRR
jgi:cation:H+ antiporter